MSLIIPGATEALDFEILDDEGAYSLPPADRIVLTIKAGDVEYDKTGSDLIVDGNVVTVTLTQVESLRLRDNSVGEAQINIMVPDALGEDRRVPCDPVPFDIGKQLYRRVIE